MRPPQRACQPSAFWLASQNSHIVSVAGCQTTMWASLPAAGLAPAGIGTCSKACWSGRRRVELDADGRLPGRDRVDRGAVGRRVDPRVGRGELAPQLGDPGARALASSGASAASGAFQNEAGGERAGRAGGGGLGRGIGPGDGLRRRGGDDRRRDSGPGRGLATTGAARRPLRPRVRRRRRGDGGGARGRSGAAVRHEGDLRGRDAAARPAEADGALGRHAGPGRGPAARRRRAGRRGPRRRRASPRPCASRGPPARTATSVRPDAVRSATWRAPRVTARRFVRSATTRCSPPVRCVRTSTRIRVDAGRVRSADPEAAAACQAPVSAPHTAAAAVDGKTVAATSAASRRRWGMGIRFSAGARPGRIVCAPGWTDKGGGPPIGSTPWEEGTC